MLAQSKDFSGRVRIYYIELNKPPEQAEESNAGLRLWRMKNTAAMRLVQVSIRRFRNMTSDTAKFTVDVNVLQMNKLSRA